MAESGAASSQVSGPAPQSAATGAGPLFRAQAIEAASGSQMGAPLHEYWAGVRWFTLAAALLVFALVMLAATVQYAPSHRVVSYLEASGGVVRLAAPVAGRVQQLRVQDGATVKAGEVLAVIDSDRATADGGSQRRDLARQFSSEKAMIEREIGSLRDEEQASVALIGRRAQGLREERRLVVMELEAGERLLASLRSQSAQVSAVAGQGYATKLQAAEKNDEVIAQESRVATMRATLARIDRDIEVASAERQVIMNRTASEIEKRRREGGELERLAVQSEADGAQSVRAPVGGVVSLPSAVTSGQSVAAGQVLFSIGAPHDPVELRLLIPPRAAGAARPGVAVRAALRAFPQERFGQFEARITRVNQAPSLPADVAGLVAVAEPVYVAAARFDKPPAGPDGRPLILRSGMLADVFVPVESRSVLEWLVEPVMRGYNDNVGRGRVETQSKAVR